MTPIEHKRIWNIYIVWLLIAVAIFLAQYYFACKNLLFGWGGLIPNTPGKDPATLQLGFNLSYHAKCISSLWPTTIVEIGIVIVAILATLIVTSLLHFARKIGWKYSLPIFLICFALLNFLASAALQTF